MAKTRMLKRYGLERDKLFGKKFNQKLILKSSSKSQAAMEYLMTYGWAILIIAIVMVALFELGIFSGTFFMPHVPPGSCHVFRPYGPRTVGSINLEGECQDALPQFVGVFNGQSSYVSTPIDFGNHNSITITAWIYLYSSSDVDGIFGSDPGILLQEGGEHNGIKYLKEERKVF
jgi:hypothetical protein